MDGDYSWNYRSRRIDCSLFMIGYQLRSSKEKRLDILHKTLTLGNQLKDSGVQQKIRQAIKEEIDENNGISDTLLLMSWIACQMALLNYFSHRSFEIMKCNHPLFNDDTLEAILEQFHITYRMVQAMDTDKEFFHSLKEIVSGIAEEVGEIPLPRDTDFIDSIILK